MIELVLSRVEKYEVIELKEKDPALVEGEPSSTSHVNSMSLIHKSN
tara:strand:+ start:855 stop:992 length:138 start_codon:yes stop_codon:yes gene_type:complete